MAALRAIARLAWRNIGRSKGRSGLILLLILLPVAAMAAGMTLSATVSTTPEQYAMQTMGRADWIVHSGGRTATTADLEALLPAGSNVEPIIGYEEGRLSLPGREVALGLRALDIDGLAAGMVALTEGRQPAATNEVAVSTGVAQIAGVGLGDRLSIKDRGTFTVVGLAENPARLDDTFLLRDPALARTGGARPSDGGPDSWLVALPPEYAGDMPLVDGEFGCSEHGCYFFGLSRASAEIVAGDIRPAILVLGGLALVEALLIAAAAFAVSIRRRQRELGLLAAAGAERRHLAGTVLAEGGLLGMLGAVIGTALGFGLVLASSPWLDDLTNRRNPPVTFDVLGLSSAAAIGLLACLLASTVPAWSVARMPVLLALSGRRPPLGSARRILLLGAGLVAGGMLLTSTGAAMRLSGGGSADTQSVLLMLTGAVLGVLGFGASGPWILERLERLGLRLPPAGRVALRDTARARSRNSPIVTAILSAFAATVAIAAFFSSTDAMNAANWQPNMRTDQIMVSGEDAASAGPGAARELGALAGAPLAAPAGSDGRDLFVSVSRDGFSGEPWDYDLTADVVVGDDEVLAALGAEVAGADLAAGGVVLLSWESTRVERVQLKALSVTDDGSEEELVSELASVVLPVHEIVTGLSEGEMPGAVISSATAREIGLTAGPAWRYAIRLDRPVTEADVAVAGTAVSFYPSAIAHASLGPSDSFGFARILLIGLSLLFALSVTGVAVALGEAESRPDQRTLLAVGADPAIRRQIAAARAGVLAILAGVLAVPAGLLPAWGLLVSRDQVLVVPVPEVIAAILVLPLAGIAGALALSRSIPAWSALREQRS